ncbi:hypothetical protein BLA29_014730 [Euroglyphus maynei]|uniref:Uncharacterized protein n=1 Tax=Euroglyphus maynei TaxID=6958 RepID=A0A1Y3BUM4_EURMA|nr:hypothetical protein BLA29_014730 [Euroglyphus maynei]
MYLRWVIEPNITEEYLDRIRTMIEEESALKHRATKLRRLLQNLKQQQQQQQN